MSGRARLPGPVFVVVLLCETLSASAQAPKVLKIAILTDCGALTQCHKPQSGQDFLFTLSKLVGASK